LNAVRVECLRALKDPGVRIFVTELTSQPEMSTLNEVASMNSSAMFVTSDVSQSGMSTFPAAPQSAPHVEQQFFPEGTAVRQLSTAVRSAPSANAAACTNVA
jgi:hypothetical protein|tara:strand:- start:6125 stop:6430 length:306 start_codon:yes stop_codon:yes gene_type:complete